LLYYNQQLYLRKFKVNKVWNPVGCLCNYGDKGKENSIVFKKFLGYGIKPKSQFSDSGFLRVSFIKLAI